MSAILKVILTGGCHPLQAWAPSIVFHDVQRYLIFLSRGQASLPVRGLRPPQAFGDLFLIFFILKDRSPLVRPRGGVSLFVYVTIHFTFIPSSFILSSMPQVLITHLIHLLDAEDAETIDILKCVSLSHKLLYSPL